MFNKAGHDPCLISYYVVGVPSLPQDLPPTLTVRTVVQDTPHYQT